MGTNLAKAAALQDDIKKGKGSGRGKVPIYTLEEGLNRFRILPPPEGMDVPWVECHNSFGVGPNEKAIVLRRPFGLEPDPVSDYIDELASKKNKASAQELQRIAPKRRFKMFVLDRNNESAGALLFDTNIMVMKQILKYFLDPEYGDLADPDEGHDVKILYTPKEKTKGKKFPEWEVTPSPKVSTLQSKTMEDEEVVTLLSTNFFEEYRIGYPSTAEYMQAVLEGEDEEFKGNRVCRPDGSALPAFGEDEEDEDGDEAPATKKARKAVVEDDEDDDTPPAKPAKKAKAAVVEEEPEEEEEDDAASDEDDDDAIQAAVAAAAAKQQKPKASGMSIADQIKAKLKGKK